MDTTQQISLIEPQEAAEHASHGPSALIDWTTNETVPVTILPATKDVKRNYKKIYLIIGSSDSASAICKYMIDSGAKHIVVVSRHPDHARDWAHGILLWSCTMLPLTT